MSDIIPHSRPTIRQNEMKKTLECMVADAIAPGNLVREFEVKLRKFLEVPVLRAVSSGTAAFFLILKLLNIKEGDEIILPSYVPAALLNPIYYLKATPVLVDVHPVDYAPLPDEIEKKITDKTRAILVAHLFGTPVSLKPYQEFNIPLIEDCAQSLGGSYEEKKCGQTGDYSFFSFYATKMISTGGTGGAVASQNPADQEKLDAMLGKEDQNAFSLSYPFQMSDLQAAMGVIQLEQLEEFIQYRKKIADFYHSHLKKAGKNVSPSFLNRKSVYYRYIVKTELEIKEALQFFEQYHIEAKRPVFQPLHRYLKLPLQEFPNTEAAYRENLSIPIYPTLKKKDAELISKIAAKI
jgi:dTDP-4-amino-4,6-dideoxygalactose transaminase